jgi:hypothetical protein
VGAKREYSAIFQIGGKLLGSFKGAMTAAHARLAKLQTSVTKFSKSMRTLTLGFAGLGAALGALGISKIIGSLFEGASDQAKEAHQRINSTIASFMLLDRVREKGLDFAKAQLDIIYKTNEELGKQGVLHSDIYNEMTKELAAGGVPPRQIKEAMSAMGDLLVRAKGVNATEEDGRELAKAYIAAIRGRTKALRQFYIYVDPTKGTGKNKVAKSYEEIYEEVLKLASATGVKGFNIARAMDPEGQVQITQNRLQDMREEIGNKMLPLQARMAQFQLRILNYIDNKIIPAVDRLSQWFKDNKISVAALVKEVGILTLAVTAFTAVISINPMVWVAVAAAAVLLLATNWDTATKAFNDYVAAQMKAGTLPKWLEDLNAATNTFTLQWKKFFIDLDAGINLIKEDWKIGMDDLHKAIKKLTDYWTHFDWTFGFAKQWKDAVAEFKGYWGKMPRWMGGGGGAGAGAAAGAAAAAPTAAAQKAAAQMPLTPEGLKAVQAERSGVIEELQRPELRNLVSATLATEAQGAEDQKNVLEALVNRAVAEKQAGTYKGIESMIKGGFYGPYNRGETAAVMAKGLSDVRSQQVGGMISEIGAGRNALGGLTDQGMINEIKGAIKEQHGEDFYGLRKASEASTAAYQYSRAYQAGGIAMRPQLATLAERGPEAVLPLARNALSSLGNGAGDTHVSFAPNITINGNATEAEQRRLDGRLRDLARDFIDQFKAAQYQERRLSYESGYG